MEIEGEGKGERLRWPLEERKDGAPCLQRRSILLIDRIPDQLDDLGHHLGIGDKSPDSLWITGLRKEGERLVLGPVAEESLEGSLMEIGIGIQFQSKIITKHIADQNVHLVERWCGDDASEEEGFSG